MKTDDIKTLFAYNRWANQRMFSVVEKLTAEQFSTPVQSSFASVEDTVLHILEAEWIWLQRWTGRSPCTTVFGASTADTMKGALQNGGVDVNRLSTLAELRAFADSLEEERAEFLRKLKDEDLFATLDYTDMVGKPLSAPLEQLLQHLVNHGTYHRGQITTLVRQLGADSTAFDMMFFFREERNRQTSQAAG